MHAYLGSIGPDFEPDLSMKNWASVVLARELELRDSRRAPGLAAAAVAEQTLIAVIYTAVKMVRTACYDIYFLGTFSC